MDAVLLLSRDKYKLTVLQMPRICWKAKLFVVWVSVLFVDFTF